MRKFINTGSTQNLTDARHKWAMRTKLEDLNTLTLIVVSGLTDKNRTLQVKLNCNRNDQNNRCEHN